MTDSRSLIKWFLVLLSGLMFGLPAQSQELLPNINVFSRNGKTHIAWRSGYTGIRQIGVQWSQDSLYNYSTIGYVSSPDKKINDYVDPKARPGKSFYRLFVLFTNNNYFFSNPATVTLEPATITEEAPSEDKPQAFQASIYVYTNADGNVNISLAHAPQKRYDIRFYDAENHFLFSLTDIRQSFLILDKSNFLRSGWYRFELFEDGKVKEKWKFYVGDL